MSWIETNPQFQAWAETARADRWEETGMRSYDDDLHSVNVNDTGSHFSLSVFTTDWQDNPDGAGERAAEWFGQFFTDPTPAEPASGVAWEAGW